MQNTKKRRTQDEAMDIEDPPIAGPSTSHQEHDQLECGDVDHLSDDEEGGIRIGDIYIPPAPKPAMTFDATGPRLIISHITNENFKSYAGTQSLGPFHKSYTSIIGPNGSGKSNIIDSMLFVFGYRASKIRSKKISVLIHSSSKYPNIKSATVAVHFCKIIDGEEGDDFTVVPGSEIEISRTAFRDSSSFYTLNGTRVQFKEVAQVLRSNGIDLDHNRFLILQGEIEQIAMMKPKARKGHEAGMLEYLEDIIGTSRYKEPIEKLTLKVAEYNEMRKEKLKRVRLVEHEKVKLEKPMKDAVDLINLTNTMLRTKNMLLQKYIHVTNKIIETKQEDLADLKMNLAAVDDKLKKLEEELEAKHNVFKESVKKHDDLRKQKEEIKEKFHGCKRKAVTTQADLTQSNKRKNNLDQLLEQERGKLIDLELIPEKNQREIEDCEALVVRHTEQKDKAEEELQTVIANIRTETQSLLEVKDGLQADLVRLKNKVDEANSTRKLAEFELNLYLSTEKKEIEKLEKVKEALEKAKAALEEKRPLQEELSRTVPANEAKLSEVNNKLQRLKQEEEQIRAEVRPLRLQLEEYHQAIDATKSRNTVLNAIMNEHRNGRLPGVYGRLGDLGGIDAKYDVAISTCCPALDHILVDNMDTALACVEFLKHNKIGRGTFIAQDKQEHFKPTYSERRDFPEDVLRLFDQVTVKDPRVQPAFYYVLRDTLVGNDLEQATRIGYGQPRYRIVTLKGEVIEICGTMSGGGRTLTRGKMSSSAKLDTSNQQDPRVMKANEEKLASLERRLAEIRNEQSELEETLGVLQRSVRDGKITLNKLNLELKSLAENTQIMEDHIKQLEASVAASKVDPEQKAALEAAIATAQVQFDKATEAAGRVEEEVRQVNVQLSAVPRGKVKDLQKTVNDHVERIDKVNFEITKLKVAINTSKRNANKTKDKIQQMEDDLSETERNLETLNSQKKECSLESAELQKDLEDLDEQIKNGAEEFSKLKQEIQKLQVKENKIKAKRLECNNAVMKMEKSIKVYQGKIPIWEKELRSLVLEDPGIEGIPGLEPIPPLAQHTTEELEDAEVEELRAELTAQKNRIGDRKPNTQAIQDYKAIEELYLLRTAELHDITTQRNDMKALYNQVKKKRTTDFLCGFNSIAAKLKEMYQMITLGGDADLELVDPLDPFSEGIAFCVRPPNKSWKNISSLSGGEKTLSSLALVFALHYYKPTPFYVMDEIDAALDFKNVSIVANYIKERTKNAQFIIISLRYNMFEVCDRLVGIYKTEDCTESVAVSNKLPLPASTTNEVLAI